MLAPFETSSYCKLMVLIGAIVNELKLKLKTSLRIRETQCLVMGRQGLGHRVPSTKEMHFSFTVLECSCKRGKNVNIKELNWGIVEIKILRKL